MKTECLSEERKKNKWKEREREIKHASKQTGKEEKKRDKSWDICQEFSDFLSVGHINIYPSLNFIKCFFLNIVNLLQMQLMQKCIVIARYAVIKELSVISGLKEAMLKSKKQHRSEEQGPQNQLSRDYRSSQRVK